MGFQIVNKDNQAIAINELDNEACLFWQFECDAKWYASPKDQWGNWFDMIGYKIHNPIDPNYTTGWDNVKHNMLLVSVGSFYKYVGNEEEMNKNMAGVHAYLKPYFELIDHWQSKGYQPKRTQD